MNDSTAEYVLGIDAGGTFTDFFLLQLAAPYAIQVHKVLSTPEAPDRAVIQGIAEMQLVDLRKSGRLQIIHGSTVATNAALEGQFEATAYVTNKGFADVLTLARQTRPALYQLKFEPILPPVSRELCVELDCRVDAQGKVLKEIDEQELQSLIQHIGRLNVKCVAINFLFSFLHPEHEEKVVASIRSKLPELTVMNSAAVLPVYKEYERGIATWLNAALSPAVEAYLNQLASDLGSDGLQIMQSSGDTVTAAEAALNPVHLLLSGPAGGATALRFLGGLINQSRLLSFDMGGTSTDVSLLNEDIETSTEGRIGPYPVAVPMVDIHTIGAGGGSIAYVDDGGMLRVGPRSAGARPGPACYGLGGEEPTVTDANLLLGRLLEDSRLAGSLPLSKDLARAALERLGKSLDMSAEEVAAGIIRLANEHMAAALRQISVNRGHDADSFRLTCFGGAGGLHVCELAEAMRMSEALVPVHGGVLSAMGMAVADQGRRIVRTVADIELDAADSAARLDEHFADIEKQLREGFTAQQQDKLVAIRRLDLRYRGQSFTLAVVWELEQPLSAVTAAFNEVHLARYGYQLDAPVELVNLQLQILHPAQRLRLPELAVAEENTCSPQGATRVHGIAGEVSRLERSRLRAGHLIDGPAIIQEQVSTSFVAPGWQARVDAYGNLLLSRH